MNNPVSRYVSNVARSAAELAKARSEASATKTSEASKDAKKASETMAEYKKRVADIDPVKSAQKVSAAESKAKAELGQFVGAVLQNRTYENKGTQANHHVTDNKNHTKTVPSSKMPDNSKKPMSKDDKAARTKYGKDTWNNGYTN